MKQVLCWSFLNSALITAALVAPAQSERSAVVIMGALVLLSLGLLWNICRVKKG